VTTVRKRERCYVVTGQGVYLSAYAVVFATDDNAARDMAMGLFAEHELYKNASRTDLDLREVPKSGAHLIWNGDY